MELIGTSLLVVFALVLEGNRPISIGGPLVLLVVLSVILVAGTFNLYRSFEFGQLSVVSPLASGYPALIVVLSVLVLKEPLTDTTGVGLALTILGMVLVARAPVGRDPARPPKNARLGVLSALVAFIAFAAFYFGLKFVVGPIPPITTAAISRGVGALTVLGYLAAVRTFRAPPRDLWPRLLGVGVLNSSATALYNYGLVFGPSLAILATLSGLFSAVTVVLAVAFLGERLRRMQWGGVAAIFVGVALLSFF